MQVSTRSEDFLIDVMELRRHMHILNEPFTNPRIVKVRDVFIFLFFVCCWICLLRSSVADCWFVCPSVCLSGCVYVGFAWSGHGYCVVTA